MAGHATDHLWWDSGVWSQGLRPGDQIEFMARAGEYVKGYLGRREVWDAPLPSVDWRLERPTRVKVLNRPTPPEGQGLLMRCQECDGYGAVKGVPCEPCGGAGRIRAEARAG